MELVAFEAAGFACALDVRRVREVLASATVTRVPGAPAALRGIFNLRGAVLPVLDLGVRLGGEPVAGTASPLVIVEVVSAGICAVLTQSVLGLHAIDDARLMAPPSNLLGPAARLVTHLAPFEVGRELLVLDVERLFDLQEIRRAVGRKPLSRTRATVKGPEVPEAAPAPVPAAASSIKPAGEAPPLQVAPAIPSARTASATSPAEGGGGRRPVPRGESHRLPLPMRPEASPTAVPPPVSATGTGGPAVRSAGASGLPRAQVPVVAGAFASWDENPSSAATRARPFDPRAAGVPPEATPTRGEPPASRPKIAPVPPWSADESARQDPGAAGGSAGAFDLGPRGPHRAGRWRWIAAALVAATFAVGLVCVTRREPGGIADARAPARSTSPPRGEEPVAHALPAQTTSRAIPTVEAPPSAPSVEPTPGPGPAPTAAEPPPTPEPAPTGSPAAEPPSGVAVTVQPGDTLWDLARRHRGNPFLWPLLHRANRATVADPDVIEPGQRLVIPGAPAELSSGPVPARR